MYRLKDNIEIYNACLDMYQTVEQEAAALFAPLEHVDVPKHFVPKSSRMKKPPSIMTSNVSGRRKKASWEVLTPMREKREQEWNSPRKKRLAAKKARNAVAENVSGALLEEETKKTEAPIVKMV